jgi:hypothetical protein
MLMTTERRPAIRTLRGWAISLLQEAGAIHERAAEAAHRDPPPGVSPDAAAAEVREVLDSIGDLCPECPTSGA